MAHDQIFKDLLRAFFAKFLDLFFPRVAARLDLQQVAFLEKELFTDIPEGSLRETDLLAQVPRRDSEPELVLIHIEVESARRQAFRRRMFEYYALLRLRQKKRVFPVVVYLVPGAGGITVETYTERFFEDDEQEILSFRYHCVGLPDLAADDYQELDNPLAPALSALMKPGALRRACRRRAASNVPPRHRLMKRGGRCW